MAMELYGACFPDRDTPALQVTQVMLNNIVLPDFRCIPGNWAQLSLSSNLFSLISLIYVVQSQEICDLCLKALTDEEINGGQS